MSTNQNCRIGVVRPAPGRDRGPWGLIGLVGQASNLSVLTAVFERRRDHHERERLVRILKRVHRKHVQDDRSIGWDELDTEVSNALMEAMGHKQFQRWLQDRAQKQMGEGHC